MGGEISVKIDISSIPVFGDTDVVVINAFLTSSDDLMALLMLTDAIRQLKMKNIELYLPYIPYARQDRVCAPGEALSIKVLAGIINAQNYEHIFVEDPHSDVSTALLDRCVAHSVTNTLRMFTPRLPPAPLTYLVAPDSGALKKVYKIASEKPFGPLNVNVVRADKTRNPDTGTIIGTVVYGFEGGTTTANMLIIDDICDGGATFVALATELKKITTGKIFLYVTHGIFSKGFDVFNGLIDEVWMLTSFHHPDTLPPNFFTVDKV